MPRKNHDTVSIRDELGGTKAQDVQGLNLELNTYTRSGGLAPGSFLDTK
jgi:hypothetical protein